ncbi:MAG TPA: SGNH/GDSL hydrolase family protein [Bryobacteraceae bacterium]|nr:SGNH/GDSL hydrolase family protein [Bryobacteraceae bacterium]
MIRRALLSLTLVALSAPLPAQKAGEHWVATWAAAPQQPVVLAPPPPGSNSRGPVFQDLKSFHDQTVRMVVRVSLGGRRIRVRLSNAQGRGPLMVGAAHVALHGQGSAIVPGSDRVLLFNGKGTVMIPAGAQMISDAVDLEVPALGDLAISVFVPGDSGPPTLHALGLQTTYISAPGRDLTGQASMEGATTAEYWCWLSGVDVLAPADAAAIVAYGDSITDGATSTVNTNRSWPSILAQRLQANRATKDLAVVNTAISGNRLLHDFVGTSALARFERDVLSEPGVKWVTLLEGINDIGFSNLPNASAGDAVTAEDVIGALRQIVERAHVHGIKVLGGTLTPYAGAAYYDEKGEARREAVNQWIRTSGTFDALVDFDAVVRDPKNPKQIRAEFNISDHLHPNDAGYKAMADAIDLAIFSSHR